MNEDLRSRLDREFSEYPVLCASERPTEAEIEESLAQIGLPPEATDQYRQFLARYGGGIVGSASIIGLRAAPAMGGEEGSFVATTNAFRNDRWPGTDSLLVFSVDHAGNPIGLDERGRVLVSDHDMGGVHELSADFDGFLESRLG